MIKRKTKEQLIEQVYSLLIENQDLKEKLYNDNINDLLYDELTKESSNKLIWLINFVLKPFKLNKIIHNQANALYNYKINTMRTLTKKELIEAFATVNKYENKLISAVPYKDYFVKVTGIKLCANCTTTLSRVHNDFQRVILNAVKVEYPYLFEPIMFYSGKYADEFYTFNVPFFTYDKLMQTLSKMRSEAKMYKSKGLSEALHLVTVDLLTLEKYITDRKMLTLQDLQSIKEPIKQVEVIPVVEVIKPVEVLVEEVKVEVIEEVKVEEVVEIKAEEIDSFFGKNVKMVSDNPKKIESIKFDVVEAYRMRKEDNISVINIAKHYDVTRGYVNSQLKKHNK